MSSRGPGALPHHDKGFLRSYCVPVTVLTIGSCPEGAPRENNGDIGPRGPKREDEIDARHRTSHSFTHFFFLKCLLCARPFSWESPVAM